MTAALRKDVLDVMHPLWAQKPMVEFWVLIDFK
jgi:hypothetical protein